MLNRIKFDSSNALSFFDHQEINNYRDAISKAHQALHSKNGEGKEFLGWVTLPKDYDKEEFKRIQKTAEKIKNNSDVLLVIGVGGSYLGAKAVIEGLSHSFRNQLDAKERRGPEIYFVGHHFNQNYIYDVMDMLEGKDVSINVISKSGTTTEPAVAFRIFRQYLENKYGKHEAAKRIYATTDKEKGALKTLAEEKGYETFVVPDDIGGRYSVLTAVGLLPIAVSGLNIKEMMKGAEAARKQYLEVEIEKNDAYQYAVLRHFFYKNGKKVEMLVNYDPRLHYFSEWWKQLFGESEGKDGNGLFPASASFSTDLHSIGQYIQDGPRHLIETILHVEHEGKSLLINHTEDNTDGLNYLAGKSMDFLNKKAFEGALLAHTDGEVPSLIVRIPEMNEYYVGYLVYFFEKACAVSGYLLSVNPFDQPGVEAYKQNMFALLGKPGYEEFKKNIQNRLKH